MRPVLATLTACLLYPAAAARAAAPAHFADAPIHALYFVDRNEGWAVGDEGVIWHTFDGGKTWERQPSGTRASLRAVHFLTPYTGYAVGRIDVPSGGSVGVVLATTDGGLKWAQLGLNALPGLNCVRFFDERTGVVAGDGSDAFPTGVFRTTDGGRTWTPMRGPRCPTWLAADFSDPDNGVLAGAWSRLATLRNGMFGAADVDTLGGRSVCGMKLQGKRAVAVGHGGLVMLSPNTAGVRWGFANLGLPPEVLACCDFNAVSTVGDNIWVVGRPGTVVLHSPDAGKTWEVQRTGQALPLRAVHFASDTEGWAAGELGTILVTRDGGKSWQVQRQGGQRAAALFVHSANDRLPIDTVALLGCEEGYLTAALRVAAPDPASAPPARATEPMRLRAAMRRTGGAAGEALWQFTVADHLRGTDPQALVAAWDRLHGNRAPEELLRQLVLALRVWRPEVVVTDAVYARADDPASGVVPEAVQEAFKRAADENAFPEQLSVLGLEPWAAKKLYAAAPRSVGAHVHIDLTALRPHCGDGLRDFAAPAFALLGREGMPPRERHFRLLAARLKDAESQGHLMDGTALASGGTARRPLEPLTEADARALEQLEKAHRTRRTLQALCESGEGAAKFATPDQVVAHLGPALEQLPPGPGARAAHALAGHFARTGQWVLA
ncbi:MAG TPA: YCF48-related protein, partial [Gemmataceae bacterium]